MSASRRADAAFIAKRYSGEAIATLMPTRENITCTPESGRSGSRPLTPSLSQSGGKPRSFAMARASA